ncbi:MAG TPA: cupin domain-containing protein [Vicinamibacterales bacterium]
MRATRPVGLALVVVAAGAAGLLAAQSDGLLMKSAVFLWEATPPVPTAQGAVRRVFRAPTATLDELEYHVTTLDPGKSPHPPHTHPNEEIIIVKDGSVEAWVNGEWMPVSTGSLIFFASNVPHTVRNTGTTPATYHVVNWRSPGGARSGGER